MPPGQAKQPSDLRCHHLTQLGAQWIATQTMTANLASRRVPKKAGSPLVRIFHQHRRYRVDGRVPGDAEYAMSNAEREPHNGITAGHPVQ